MPASRPQVSSSREPPALDAVVIGAGVAGLCALHRLRDAGLSVAAIERADGVGGVWYWNRYPGARFDSESYTYCYSFSPELLAEWDWQEHFAAQPEVLAYLRHAARRFDLEPHIRFGTTATGSRFDDATATWTIETDCGSLRCRFLVTAAGALSEPRLPHLPGLDTFAGRAFHTARWPEGGAALAGRRVGVIGTGASGVQVIQTIAAEVAHLTVFQRTPTYCIPQRNRPIEPAEMRDIKGRYPELFARCRESFGGFLHTFDPRSGRDVTAEERRATFEALWQQPGFAFWFGNFGDLLMDAAVNEHACEFLRGKIRERVHDPETARKLMPRHPFGTKRVPLENGYYEVFNRSSVILVDLREAPIERITPAGVRTTAGEHPLDVLVLATGFAAVTGPLARIDIRGRAGQSLREAWRDGPATCLGLQVAGFPNLFMVAGPHNAASLCNAVRCTEQNVDWIVDCIRHLRARGCTRIVPTAEAQADWTRHVEEAAAATLLQTMTDSWFFQRPGATPKVLIYPAGAVEHRRRCEAVARAGYPGFELS